jgi:hypothetical protein
MRLIPPLLVFLLASSVSAAPVEPPPFPRDGLVGHWRFDTLAAGRVADLSPLGNPLLVDHGSVRAEGGPARSLVCDGFETGARLDERTLLRFPSGLTLAIWVHPLRTRGYEFLFGRPNSNPSWTTPVTGLALSDARPVFGLFAAGKKILLEGPALPTRAWSLIVATTDGRRAALWIDGRRVAEAAQPLPVPAVTDPPWYVGRSQTVYFQGRLGDAAVWNRALASAEITAVFNATVGRYRPAGGAAVASTAAVSPDRTVEVESPGSRPDGAWRARPTRTLAGLAGFTPGAPPPTDRWGGRTDRPARRATGYFRTEQVDGRWWLVTPDGHLYWNVGVNSVRPPRQTPSAQHARFAADATRELRAHGFNGLGNGGLSALQAAPAALPWTIRLSVMAGFAREHRQTYPTSGHTGFTEQCFPVFHPDFPAWARKEAAALAATADDPSVIGIFTDNELQCPVDLLDRHLRLPAADPYLGHGRRAALAWLAGRGQSADPKALTLKDRYQFIAHVFGTYLRIVHGAVRARDRNHLILGPRFNVRRGQFDNPWFWTAVGPWLDVAAVNYYGEWGPQREDIQGWSEALRRPVMLTEWYSKALDAPRLANTKGAGWVVRTQADRARYYQHFALGAYEVPALVGFHYFKYMDDDADSVALDSAGGANKGLYQADGSPWPELLAAAGAVNRQVYPLLDFFAAR